MRNMDIDDFSIKTGVKRNFGTTDYVLFSLLFVSSAAIGFYHAFRDKHKENEENFHLGGRKMHPIPVGLSLTATFISALALLGTPAEMYTNGTMYTWIVLAMLPAVFIGAHLFIPVFFKLQKTSCFEYLEMRFGVHVKLIAVMVFLLQTLLYMTLVLYAPSIAFESVTGVSLWGCLIGTSVVCTLYTALGGMKTVVWTDSFQVIVILTGMLCLLIIGSTRAGGFANAWDVANDKGRIMLTEFSPDPKMRHSIWTVVIGGSIFWTYNYGVNQAQVQRALSLPSIRQIKIAYWLNFVGFVVIIIMACLIGVVMFAIYSDCDPVKYGLIDRNDQLIPLLVLDVLGTVPGLSGIFIASVFSGSLSTVSSGLNAMSAIIGEDFIKPIASAYKYRLDGRKGIILAKILVVIIGLGQFGFAVLISKLKGLIVQMTYSLIALIGGPVLGIFIAGMFFPWTNKHGALIGFIFALAFMTWLTVGSLLAKPPGIEERLLFSTSGCNWNVSDFSTPAPETQTTTTARSSIGTTGAVSEEPFLWDFYRISYLWYSGLGMIITVTVSLITSFMTGYTRPNTVDCRLMCPFVDILFPFLPESILKPMRFGVDYEKDYSEVSSPLELRKVSVTNIEEGDDLTADKEC